MDKEVLKYCIVKQLLEITLGLTFASQCIIIRFK